jgi:hypothetical protein
MALFNFYFGSMGSCMYTYDLYLKEMYALILLKGDGELMMSGRVGDHILNINEPCIADVMI